MELNERVYSTEELKNFASNYEPKSKLSTKNIPSFESLEPGIKSRINWSLKDYNQYVEKFNKLRDDMLNKRVKDIENSSAKKNLQLYKNKFRKIYTNDIKKYFQKNLKQAGKNEKRINVNREKEQIRKKVAASKYIPPDKR